MDLFALKKIIGHAAMPLTLLTIIIVLGIFWTVKNRKGWSIVFQTTALMLLLAITNQNVAYKLLSPSEQIHKQFDLSQSVNTVVVLGCGHTNDGMLPITAQLASCSLYRIAEAIRIYRANPGSKILATGYGGTEPFSNAYMVKQVAVSMGVPEHDIYIYELPKDTKQEASTIASKVDQSKFALVTSASHMPRAIKTFNNAGMFPIAAPTGHMAKFKNDSNWWKHFPSSEPTTMIERWWHEAMGTMWMTIQSL